MEAIYARKVSGLTVELGYWSVSKGGIDWDAPMHIDNFSNLFSGAWEDIKDGGIAKLRWAVVNIYDGRIDDAE